MSKECMYCLAEGRVRATKEDGVDSDVHVCESCWLLLKNPKTALPLIRGHLAMSLKGSVPQATLDRMINAYMGKIAAWKPRN